MYNTLMQFIPFFPIVSHLVNSLGFVCKFFITKQHTTESGRKKQQEEAQEEEEARRRKESVRKMGEGKRRRGFSLSPGTIILHQKIKIEVRWPT